MPFKPPLTKDDLHAIKLRRDGADVPALLWEIARLRAIVLRADQLQKALGDAGGGVGMLVTALRAELDGEPCVAEFPRMPE